MAIGITRRLALRGAAVAALATSATAAETTRLRMFWWGSKERADRTFKVNQLYSAKHPEISISGETLGWGDYWPRMAVQAAGHDVPDIIQMDYRYIYEYARRGALLAFDAYMPGTLAIEDFGKDAIDSGRVDGKLYGVPLGLNSMAMIYSKTAFEKAKLPPPTHETSWTQYADLTVELTKAMGKQGYWGSADASGDEWALEVWVRQRGRPLYDANGKVGYTAEDVGDWFAYWDDLRKRQGCVPAEVQALDQHNIDTEMLSLGKAATAFEFSNLLVGMQALTHDSLAMTMFPQGPAGSKPGQYLKPAMLWSVNAATKHPEDAVRVVDFFVEDGDAAKALSTERGVPPSAAMRKLITPDLNDLDRQSVDFVTLVSSRVGPLPPPPPKGAGENELLLRRVSEQVAFGKMKPAEAGKQYMNDASANLARG